MLLCIMYGGGGGGVLYAKHHIINEIFTFVSFIVVILYQSIGIAAIVIVC